VTEVGVTEFRRELKIWLERAKAGDELLVTDRGLPVVRVVGAGMPTALERLTAQGHVSAPRAAKRPRAQAQRLIRARGSVSELLIAERDTQR
jgi:prevent-host-death family protein